MSKGHSKGPVGNIRSGSDLLKDTRTKKWNTNQLRNSLIINPPKTTWKLKQVAVQDVKYLFFNV
jgi:hypothetical protein